VSSCFDSQRLGPEKIGQTGKQEAEGKEAGMTGSYGLLALAPRWVGFPVVPREEHSC
jgi:hypothetical protein